jgi:Asp-tRNA(Asn)/Glu-tRNA(Gln) amidotransferase A subunit family amidase
VNRPRRSASQEVNVALAARVRRRELSPVEVIDAVLSRLERLNLTLNAFCPFEILRA